ncbi:DUF11 domain-containing protein [Xylophilus rhododendri]|uniref:DUF11 domain-containing protein n=1 Tax=Xylophilus rhododendri TaxID=2697032 RepID=UPI001E346540|nr:DUF11 domain-containing protein [Xylophilus rhododendri]
MANRDLISISNGAILLLSKSASYPAVLVAGESRIEFNVRASNIGMQLAQPARSLLASSTLTVNGSPADYVLLRDLIPSGTRYLPGSLQTAAANAIRLYRRQSDPPFSYQTTEMPGADEVAIGLPGGIEPNVTVAMQFAVTRLAGQSGDIANIAQSFYYDGNRPAESASNMVVIPAGKSWIGLAKQASNAVANRNPDGSLDGTINLQFRIRVKNYGDGWLHNVQATDILEGSGADKFGSYTTANVLASGQYTVIPGSIRVVSGSDVSINAAYNGTASSANLLAPGVRLSPGSDVTVQFEVKVNTTGRVVALANNASGSASTAEGQPPSVFDDSVDGLDPDPDADGNPNNNASTTFVATQIPILNFTKTAGVPRRVDAGVYEVDYTFRLKNAGSVPAPNVRVVDNLACTFGADSVASWSLVNAPQARNGNLSISPGFTGRATCNRTQLESKNPADLPGELVLNMTDGSRSLAPGQSEEITLTVRITLKSAAPDGASLMTNKAWAAAFRNNMVGFDAASVVAASSSTADTLLVDPQGIVYDASSRAPIAGAVATLTRLSCQSSISGAITAADLLSGDSGAYRFNGDGSASMTTGADGAYQFVLRSPPVTDLCTYGLTVQPPAGSAYVAPSELIPASSGVFSNCGAVVPGALAPRDSDPTIFYNQVLLGPRAAGGQACEVFHNHIPLDPGNVRGLILRKEGSKRQVELGDFMDYALTVVNKTGMATQGVTFDDHLPLGFAYVPGSAQLNGVRVGNPSGGAGPQLTFGFSDLPLAPEASATLRYRVRVGVGAPTHGDAVNRAVARSAALQSNQASWTVRLTGGVFSDEAFAFGKVYLDCKRDGRQEGRMRWACREFGYSWKTGLQSSPMSKVNGVFMA